jgi:hypothetical protein
MPRLIQILKAMMKKDRTRKYVIPGKEFGEVSFYTV